MVTQKQMQWRHLGTSSPNKVHGIGSIPMSKVALKVTYDKIHIIKNG